MLVAHFCWEFGGQSESLDYRLHARHEYSRSTTACERCPYAITNIFLIDMDNETFEGKSPLICAIENGRHELVNVLIAAGADVNFWASAAGGTTALMAAIRSVTLDTSTMIETARHRQKFVGPGGNSGEQGRVQPFRVFGRPRSWEVWLPESFVRALHPEPE